MCAVHLVRLFVACVTGVLFALTAVAQDEGRLSGPSVSEPCMECGVIYEIRPVTTEREVAKTLEERAPPMGPFINIPLTRDPAAKPQIGVVGSKDMRKQLEQTIYEVVVRFDDDRFILVEVEDVSTLRVGDRVHVHQNRVEPANQP